MRLADGAEHELSIHDGRRTRSHAAVFDEVTRAEMTQAKAPAKPRGLGNRNAAGNTRPSAPGIRDPPRSSPLNLACANDKSASSVIQDTGTYRAESSPPTRVLARPASRVQLPAGDEPFARRDANQAAGRGLEFGQIPEAALRRHPDICADPR